MGELLSPHEKDQHNEKLQKDVTNFIDALPSNLQQIPELKAAFETKPQTMETLNRDVVELMQQFLVKHTTALGITPFGLQHSSTKVLVSVCPLLQNILYIRYIFFCSFNDKTIYLVEYVKQMLNIYIYIYYVYNLYSF